MSSSHHHHLIPDQVAALPSPSVDDALLRDVDRLSDRPTLAINPDLQVHLNRIWSKKLAETKNPSFLMQRVVSVPFI